MKFKFLGIGSSSGRIGLEIIQGNVLNSSYLRTDCLFKPASALDPKTK